MTMKILLAIALMWGLTNEEVTVEKRSVNAPVSIKLLDDNKALLRYKTTPESSVLVRIFDEDNRKYVKKQYLPKNQSFAKYYDFSKLGSGNYTVEIIERNRIAERIPIVIPSFNESKHLETSLEKLDWNSFKLSFNQPEPADLTVFAYQNGILIHEERLENVSSLDRKYRLMGVNPSHRVEFAVVSEGGKVEWLKGN
jgi:hypothetical protein